MYLVYARLFSLQRLNFKVPRTRIQLRLYDSTGDNFVVATVSEVY